jgi:hypothetical protein
MRGAPNGGMPLGGLVIHLEVFAQAPHGQQSADAPRQQVHEVLDQRDLAHPFQVAQVIAHDTGQPFPLPEAKRPIALREQGLREPAEPEQRCQVLVIGRARRTGQFVERKRMEPEVAISPRERVTALAVMIEPRGSRHDKPALALLGVVQTLHQVPPSRILVDLVENDQRLVWRQFPAPECGAGLGVIPPAWGRQRTPSCGRARRRWRG